MAGEKEFNGILFDQLELLERIEKVAKKTGDSAVLEAIAEEKAFINRKLHQEVLNG